MTPFFKALGIEVKNPQEVFTHLDNEGVPRTFLCETMRLFCETYACSEIKRVRIPLTKELADYMRSNHGVEQDRIDRLVDPYLSRPVIAISWADVEPLEVTIIDGAHRVVKNFEAGLTELNCFVFLPDFWENFMLSEDVSRQLIDEGFLNRVSGVIENERKESGKRH